MALDGAVPPGPRTGAGLGGRRAGRCHQARISAGISSGTSSHQAVAAASAAPAMASSAATGASAASLGPGPGGVPPRARAIKAGRAAAVRINAKIPVAAVPTPIPQYWRLRGAHRDVRLRQRAARPRLAGGLLRLRVTAAG